ncbi:MAG: drug/metabolite transporter (DMT)-like permease [Candidatus Endobugula sp.]|jgi:drug/metabolite transporter (DMT)-like permease
MPVWFYVLLGILVNCLWGTTILAPYYLADLNPVAIAIGRYLAYGLISIVFVLFNLNSLRKLNYGQWKQAFLFAFTGNVGYYICIALSVHYAGITTTALIESTTPIVMIVASQLSGKEFDFQSLLFPVIMVLTGIVMLNQSQGVGIDYSANDYQWYVGLGFAVLSLWLWAWYALSNARFLKQNPSISSNIWSVAIGVGCFVQSIIGLSVFAVSGESIFMTTDDIASSTIRLIVGCLFLGVFISWLVTIWWNQVSRYIPMAIIGPLFVFESLSSLTYGYIVDKKLPATMEVMAVVLIIGGVALSMMLTSRGLKKATPVLQGS